MKCTIKSCHNLASLTAVGKPYVVFAGQQDHCCAACSARGAWGIIFSITVDMLILSTALQPFLSYPEGVGMKALHWAPPKEHHTLWDAPPLLSDKQMTRVGLANPTNDARGTSTRWKEQELRVEAHKGCKSPWTEPASVRPDGSRIWQWEASDVY
eukprot:scaffold307036_cov21-Tisochrysis_lutea.AAC.1